MIKIIITNLLNMKHLIINQQDIYKRGDVEYFKYQYSNRTVYDNKSDISKNNIYNLKLIAHVCELNYKGLSKNQLAELIENSGCLVLKKD